MNFDLLDFQSEIKQILLNTRNKKRLSHAYIFQGPNGVGKREMACFFATMLYQENPDMAGEVAKQIINNEHVNVFRIESDTKVIRKEEIVALQNEFSKTSQVSGPRIYIIIDADKMNQNSQNSLLKFIEEPEPGIYGILCTTNISQLLPTITSRCQTINFKSLDENTLIDQLIQNNIDKNMAAIVSTQTNNLEQGLELAKSENIDTLKKLFEQFLTLRKTRDGIVFRIKNMSYFEIGSNLNQFLNLLIVLYEDILTIFNGSINIHLKGYADNINKLKETITQEKAIAILELLYNLNKKLLANVSAKNVASNLFVNLF